MRRCFLPLCLLCAAAPALAAPPIFLGSIINAIMERIVYGEPSQETVNIAGQPPIRKLPPNANVGVMSPPEGRLVRMDGKERMLSPGAQIRDRHNRIVLPGSLQDNTRVLYVADAQQALHRLWIITDQELEAVREYKKLLEEQQASGAAGASPAQPARTP